jgi:hypothetical protein
MMRMRMGGMLMMTDRRGGGGEMRSGSSNGSNGSGGGGGGGTVLCCAALYCFVELASDALNGNLLVYSTGTGLSCTTSTTDTVHSSVQYCTANNTSPTTSETGVKRMNECGRAGQGRARDTAVQ